MDNKIANILSKKYQLKLLIFLICELLLSVSLKAQDTTKQSKNHIIESIKNWFQLPTPTIIEYPIEAHTTGAMYLITKEKDTYLSPLYYRGKALAVYTTTITHLTKSIAPPSNDSHYSLFTIRPQRILPQWIKYIHYEFGIGYGFNPAQNHIAYQSNVSANRSYLYRLTKSNWGKLYIGLGGNFQFGLLYYPTNGNNPISVKTYGDIVLSSLYTYQLPFSQFPATFRVYGMLSLFGLAFSPQYGESYYELFSLGHRFLGRFYFTYPTRSLSSTLSTSMDIPLFDYCILQLGYQFNYHNTNINFLQKRFINNGLLIGLTYYNVSIGGRLVNHNNKYPTPL